MPVPSSINDLSTTASSNSPGGSETPGDGDNYLRALSAFIATLRDKLNGTSSPTINAGTFSGTHTFSSGNLLAGTYTPTGTGVSNCTIFSVLAAQYMRVGNTVTVSGIATIVPAGTGICTFGLSLPIASNFTSFGQLAGSGGMGDSNNVGVYIVGDTVNDRAQLSLFATSLTAKIISYNYTYRVA